MMKLKCETSYELYSPMSAAVRVFLEMVMQGKSQPKIGHTRRASIMKLRHPQGPSNYTNNPKTHF